MHTETVSCKSDNMTSVKGNTGSAYQNWGTADIMKFSSLQVLGVCKIVRQHINWMWICISIFIIQNLPLDETNAIDLRQRVYTTDNKVVQLPDTGNCRGKQHQQVQGVKKIAGQQVQK